MAKKTDWFVIINADNETLASYGAALEKEATEKARELIRAHGFLGVFLVLASLRDQPHVGRKEPPCSPTKIEEKDIKRRIYVSILDPDKDYSCQAANAAQIFDWLKNRGGIAIWKSINLSNPSGSWTAPYLDDKGAVKGKPTWEADSKPARVITDPAEVWVMVPKEVKRFHIAIRAGAQGMSLKLSDGASRRVREAVAKEGIGAWYEFDYMTQEAVIFVAEREQRIAEFFADKEKG